MAGRHLKQIFKAFQTRDELAFRRAAAEIIEEEEAKHHNALARDLRRALVAGSEYSINPLPVSLPAPPRDREGDWELAELRESSRLFDDLVLNRATSDVLIGIVEEVRQWERLDNAGIRRRQRFILEGPPGCGKTSAAEALAGELGRPFLLVRLDSVVSSYLGETASNLRRILDFANEAPFVVLFDEFDSLGRSREDSSDHGEMKRVVTAFLQMMDRYSGPSVILAATNYPTLLDQALWRRFDEVIEFPRPSVHEIRRLLRLRLKRVPTRGISVDSYASRLRGLPHAAIDKMVDDAHRRAVLRGAPTLDANDMDVALNGVTRRPW